MGGWNYYKEYNIVEIYSCHILYHLKLYPLHAILIYPYLSSSNISKGVDLAPLAEMIKENIKEVYLIGVIADKIESELKKVGYEDSKIHKLVNLENSLQDMKKRFTKDSDEVILLSPATSSYDQFNSFEHRGKVFKELVLKIFG